MAPDSRKIVKVPLGTCLLGRGVQQREMLKAGLRVPDLPIPYYTY
jgi:hypothetical protein